MPTYAIGDRVSQAQYGDGTVTAANDVHTSIDFDEHGVRTFSTPLVRLSPTDTVAPVRSKPVRRKRATKATTA